MMSTSGQYDSIHQHELTSSSEKITFVMTFRVAHWDTLDGKSCILVSKGKLFLSILMTTIICAHFSQLESHCGP